MLCLSENIFNITNDILVIAYHFLLSFLIISIYQIGFNARKAAKRLDFRIISQF
jgi:hypothetical protein